MYVSADAYDKLIMPSIMKTLPPLDRGFYEVD